MIVDEYPKSVNEDVAAKTRNAKEGPGDAVGQAKDPEEVLVRVKRCCPAGTKHPIIGGSLDD